MSRCLRYATHSKAAQRKACYAVRPSHRTTYWRARRVKADDKQTRPWGGFLYNYSAPWRRMLRLRSRLRGDE